jgi:hypothetical protein
VESTTESLAIGAAASAIAALLVLVRLHLLPGGRELPLASVSEHGSGPHHRYYRALVLLLGLAAALLVVALARGSEAGDRALFFLGAFAAARLAIAFVMSDPAGAPVTPRGRVHVLLGAIAFTAIAFGAADVTNAIEDTPGWSDGAGSVLRAASDAVGVTVVLALAAYLVPQARERAFGIAERLLYVAIAAWLLVASIHLATLAAGG